MGFVQNWIDRRRRRELERINQEIEDLKRRGPDYIPREQRPSLAPSRSSPQPIMTARTLCVLLSVVVIGLIVYYQMEMGSLKEDFVSKDEEALTLQNKLDQALVELNKTEGELQVKKQTETTLTTQYSDLQEEIDSLNDALYDMNKTLAGKDDEIQDTQQELDDTKKVLKDMEHCIENNTIDDKEDCL
mgnify:CR=1 FL=1